MPAQFPLQVWDGLSPSRTPAQESSPSAEDFDQLKAEIVAMQALLMQTAFVGTEVDAVEEGGNRYPIKLSDDKKLFRTTDPDNINFPKFDDQNVDYPIGFQVGFKADFVGKTDTIQFSGTDQVVDGDVVTNFYATDSDGTHFVRLIKVAPGTWKPAYKVGDWYAF